MEIQFSLANGVRAMGASRVKLDRFPRGLDLPQKAQARRQLAYRPWSVQGDLQRRGTKGRRKAQYY